MIKISAVIITYNEERNIVQCLQSLEGIADEIIVVDSYSADATEALCKPFNVRFLQHPFEGYMQQKSWACEQSAYECILSLDADEQLSDDLKKSILAVKNDWKADGYYFNRRNNYLGKWIRHCGWYPDAKLRLWNRRKGRWSGINLHESVKMNENAVVSKLHGDLLHYSYYSLQQHIDQINKFTEIAAKEGIVKGKNATLFIAVFKSIWKFKRDYIFKLGFLDGYYGFVICAMSAYAVFVKYIKIRELKKAGSKK
jgi:glycosyltransferase involved in cell wall biosynthesis